MTVHIVCHDCPAEKIAEVDPDGASFVADAHRELEGHSVSVEEVEAA